MYKLLGIEERKPEERDFWGFDLGLMGRTVRARLLTVWGKISVAKCSLEECHYWWSEDIGSNVFFILMWL